MNKWQVSLLLSALLTGLAWAEEPVYFADPNLKTAVEDELWMTDPTPTDMLGLLSLQAGSLEIEDLTGLEHAINLQSLWLRFNSISDISLLSGLTNLEYLVLHRNGVSDLSPLAGLTNLAHLNLDTNHISDVSPLSDLVNLSELNLYNNDVSDISPLIGLMSLSVLDLRRNPLSEDAFTICVPQIIANNPGVDVLHDRGPFRVVISSTAGGMVIQPGEGEFIHDDGRTLLVEAKADPGFVFAGFSGTMHSQENPALVELGYDYDIHANFESLSPVLHVDDDATNDPGPADAGISDPHENGTPERPFDGIQEAIEVAAIDARVVVRPGTYHENIDFLGKSLQLTGNDSDPNVSWPVIYAAGSGPVVRIAGRKAPGCLLTGFVVAGGVGRSNGVVSCESSSLTISNCLIAGNRPGGSEGALAYCVDSDVTLINCTITDNHIDVCGGGLHAVDSNMVLTNSIFWNNTYSCWSTNAQIVTGDGAGVFISYSNVEGGWPGLGNIDVDPLFARDDRWVHPDNPDMPLAPHDQAAVWVMGDYHLRSRGGRWDPDAGKWAYDDTTSPCIDGGAPTSPLGQEPVPHGAIINMGAYGGTSQASKSDHEALGP